MLIPFSTRLNKRKILIVLAIGGLLAAGSIKWLFFSKPPVSSIERQPVPVEYEPVKVGSISRRVNTNGILTAAESVNLCAEIEGRVSKILFRQGQEVKEGDILIQLDDSVHQARVREAKALLNLLKSEYSRAKQLYDKNFGHKAAVEKALAELRVKEAALEAAEVSLAQTQIRAPFDGVVGLQNINVGGTVARNQELVTVVSLNPLYVDFTIPDSFLRYLEVGDIVDVTIEGTDSLSVECKIVAIDPKADPSTHSIKIRAELENLSEEMRPGQFARVNVGLGEETNALLIPMGAVEKEGDRYFVYIIIDRTAVLTEVTLGLRSGPNVQVTSGLNANDLIVLTAMKVSDGTPVRLISNEQETTEKTDP